MQEGATRPVRIEHSRQFLGFRSADAVGNEECTDLGGCRFFIQDQLEGISGLLTAHSFTGVFSAADLAQVSLEALLPGCLRIRQRAAPTLTKCSAAKCPQDVAFATNRLSLQ